MAGPGVPGAALDVRGQVRLDRFESAHAGCVIGASRQGLADELRNDIWLGIPRGLRQGSFGQCDHAVPDEPGSVPAIDLAGCETGALLSQPAVDAHDPVEDRDQGPDEPHPREQPKTSGWRRTLQCEGKHPSHNARGQVPGWCGATGAKQCASAHRGGRPPREAAPAAERQPPPLHVAEAALAGWRAVKKARPTCVSVRLDPGGTS
jgi:hypothetical protein